MILCPDYYLQIRKTKIYHSEVKESFKITALGDTHMSKMIKNTKLYPLQKQLEKEEPDYFVFIGDIIDLPSQLRNKTVQQNTIELIKTAAAIAPVLLVLGSHDYIEPNKKNHDYSYNRYFWEEVIGTMENVHLLHNDIYQNNQVLFMGYWQTLEYYYNDNDIHHENLEKFYEDFINYPNLYKNLPKDIPRIALIHSPEFIKLKRNRELIQEYDLLISGHMHDGCVPFGIGSKTTGLISPKKELFPKMARGFFTLDTDTNVIVSGGVIKISECAPKYLHLANHLCPMQMDSIIFTSENQPVEISKSKIYTR